MGPVIQTVEKIVDVPVVKQIEIPQITTVEKIIEVPQSQTVEKVVEIPMVGETKQGNATSVNVPLPAVRQQGPAETVAVTEWGPDLPVETSQHIKPQVMPAPQPAPMTYAAPAPAPAPMT